MAILASLPDRSRRGEIFAHEDPWHVGEHKTNMLGSLVVARRPDPEKPDVLNEEELKQLRHNLAHLSPGGVREFYERAFEVCRLVYNRLPSPRKMQTLVQVWKQLWKWR